MNSLTPTETHAIKEIARAHAVAIEKTGLFTQMAKDEDLRHLLHEAQRKMIRQYEELRSYGQTEQAGAGWRGDRADAPLGDWSAGDEWANPRETRSGFAHPDPKSSWTPGATASSLSDRMMVTDLLECCKHLATFSVMYALECADRNLRRTFTHLVQEHLDLGYDAFRYMQNQGWYGLKSAQSQQIAGISSQFRPVSQASAPRPYANSSSADNTGRNMWETSEENASPRRDGWRDRPGEND